MASNERTQFQESIAPAALRSYVAEFVSTFLFVFATVGSTMSARKLAGDMIMADAPVALVATALAEGFALFGAIFMAADFSGGHLNPAVTFAFAIVGQISIPTAIFYWASQTTAATISCLVLHLFALGQAVETTEVAYEMTGFNAAILEGVGTFALVYAILISRNSSMGKCCLGAVAGLVVAAGTLALGGFTGGSMNPVRSFGPAVVGGNLKNQAVYWVGPLIGAAVAALLHHNMVVPAEEGSSSTPVGACSGRAAEGISGV